MCPIKMDQLTFDHIVDFAKDSTTFAAAREYGTNHLRIFLIYTGSGNVYTRNGRADSWEQLTGPGAEAIRLLVTSARGCVPVYRINGSHS